MGIVLVTGAGGNMGRMLRAAAPRLGVTLRLLDEVPQPPAQPGEPVEVVTGSIRDPAVLERACAGTSAVIHLAAISNEAAWADLIAVNLTGTRDLLDAALAAGTRRVVMASSHHAAGLWPRPQPGRYLPADVRPRPDSFYGLTKAAVEALAELYCQRYGMDIFCLRIGHCFERPRTAHGAAIWLSPGDWVRLVRTCLASPTSGYHLLWGVSANTQGWLSLAEGRRIGYEPHDDGQRQSPPAGPTAGYAFLGGALVGTALGARTASRHDAGDAPAPPAGRT